MGARLIHRCCFLAAIALAGASCDSGGPALHPVRGKVLFDNQPPAGATVVFHRTGTQDSGAPMPSGVVGADGAFTLSTFPHGEGAPEGEYIVLVTWFPADARQMDNPQNKLPDKYADQTAALLKATVKPGENELTPFLLTP